jgi:hypothetical protein
VLEEVVLGPVRSDAARRASEAVDAEAAALRSDRNSAAGPGGLAFQRSMTRRSGECRTVCSRYLKRWRLACRVTTTNPDRWRTRAATPSDVTGEAVVVTPGSVTRTRARPSNGIGSGDSTSFACSVPPLKSTTTRTKAG